LKAIGGFVGGFDDFEKCFEVSEEMEAEAEAEVQEASSNENDIKPEGKAEAATSGENQKYTSFVAGLSPEAKKWYALAIVGAVASDGVIEDDEMQFLKIAIKFLDDVKDIHNLLLYAKEKKIPKLTQLRSVTRANAFRLIIALGKIVIEDDKMAPSEAEYLESVAAKLGFDEKVSGMYITFLKESIRLALMRKKVRDEEQRMKQELDKLMKTAFNTKPVFK